MEEEEEEDCYLHLTQKRQQKGALPTSHRTNYGQQFTLLHFKVNVLQCYKIILSTFLFHNPSLPHFFIIDVPWKFSINDNDCFICVGRWDLTSIIHTLSVSHKACYCLETWRSHCTSEHKWEQFKEHQKFNQGETKVDLPWESFQFWTKITWLFIRYSTGWDKIRSPRQSEFGSWSHFRWEGQGASEDVELQLWFQMRIESLPDGSNIRYVHGCHLAWIFHVLQRLPIRVTRWDLCCISKSTMKHRQKSDWKSDLPNLSYGYWKHIFVDFLTDRIHKVLLIVITFKCGVFNTNWRCSPFFFKHVPLWCVFFDPYGTPHQSI